jgi:hypothetical protein
MPSAASWRFSRLQNAHHVVVYMVSGCVIGRPPLQLSVPTELY